jgi:hypothetical protein
MGADWGDYDADGDLDLLMSGYSLGLAAPRTLLYRNDGMAAGANAPPTAPTLLAESSAGGTAVTLAWTAAVDAETPTLGLTYNLRVSATPGGFDLWSPMSDPSSGARRVPRLGAANHRTSWLYRPPATLPSYHYWSVQAIDGAWAGGPFAAESRINYAPFVASVTDVPGDQGGWVRLAIEPSVFDHAAASPPVGGYNVWRKVDGSQPAAAFAAAEVGSLSPELRVLGAYRDGAAVRVRGASRTGMRPRDVAHAPSFPPGTWELVGSFFASQLPAYTYVAATAADDPTITSFLVSSHTTTPATWYLSDVAAGSSADNIAPGPPQPFTAFFNGSTGVDLAWGAAPEEDFQYFRVYRGATPDFTPAPANLVHSTIALAWLEENPETGTNHYKLTAIDHAGNESPAALASSAVTSVGNLGGFGFALRAATPNPFSASTAMTIELPERGDVRLEVFDIRGRRVHTLVSGSLPSGKHTVTWDGRGAAGRAVPTGIYVVRLRASSFETVRRVVRAR